MYFKNNSTKNEPILLRDAVLARYVPWPYVRPSVCLSVTSRSFIKMAEHVS